MPCVGVDSGGGVAGFSDLPVVPGSTSRVVRLLLD